MPEPDLGAVAAQIDAWVEELAKAIMGASPLREWEYDGRNDASLPPDLTPYGDSWPGVGESECGSFWQTDVVWTCTRRTGHAGRHAAGDGDIILAVWR